jgi:plastocyanin domain-containing protein
MIPTKSRSVSGVLALVLAIAGAAFAEAACSKSEPAQAATAVSATPSAAGRHIAVTASEAGYSPASIDVKKGEQVVLVFTRTTKSECLSQVVIPDLSIKKDLPVNTPVEVPVKIDKEGKVGFECGMAMVKGTINVSGS